MDGLPRCLGPQQSLGGLSGVKRQTGAMTQGTVRESSQSTVGTQAAFGPGLAHKHVLPDSHFFLIVVKHTKHKMC